MSTYAFQLWSKYTQTDMKCLRNAYNKTYRIMGYMHRNVKCSPTSLCQDLWCLV